MSDKTMTTTAPRCPFRQGLAAAAAALAVATLAGCSGAPSESDMRAAVDRQVADQLKAAESLIGRPAPGVLPEIRSFRKVGCKNDGEKAWRCDVEVEVAHLGATNKSAQSMRFVDGSDGWRVSN